MYIYFKLSTCFSDKILIQTFSINFYVITHLYIIQLSYGFVNTLIHSKIYFAIEPSSVGLIVIDIHCFKCDLNSNYANHIIIKVTKILFDLDNIIELALEQTS